MSLLQYKKKRRRLSGKFFYVLKKAIVFNRAKNDWFLRLPKEILRLMNLRYGSKIDMSAEGTSVVLTTVNLNKKYAARRRVRARLTVRRRARRF